MTTRRTVFITSAVLAALVVAAGVPDAGAQSNPQLTQLKQKVLALQSTYTEYVTGQHTYASDVSIGSKKVWAAALEVTGQNSTAGAGFQLPPLSSAGTMPGAKVTATFVVSQAVGNKTKLFVDILKVGGQGHVARGELVGISATGTYTVTTDALTLQAGSQYIARAWVYAIAQGTTGEICAVVATIPDIKWEL